MLMWTLICLERNACRLQSEELIGANEGRFWKIYKQIASLNQPWSQSQWSLVDTQPVWIPTLLWTGMGGGCQCVLRANRMLHSAGRLVSTETNHSTRQNSFRDSPFQLQTENVKKVQKSKAVQNGDARGLTWEKRDGCVLRFSRL